MRSLLVSGRVVIREINVIADNQLFPYVLFMSCSISITTTGQITNTYKSGKFIKKGPAYIQ